LNTREIDRFVNAIALLVCIPVSLSACVSMNPGEGPQSVSESTLYDPGRAGERETEAFGASADASTRPRQVNKTMSTEQAIEVAINVGGESIDDARRLVTQRKQWASAHRVLEAGIEDGIIKYDNIRLANSVALYQTSPLPASVRLLQALTGSGRPIARQLGWQMAAAMPSRTIAAAIDQELGRAVSEGDEASVLLPQMAVAVQANKLKSAYTLVRQGLMQTGQEAFALAMANLDPRRASSDFLDYLSLASPEELRQLTQNSVNVYTCLIALKHIASYPAPLSNPNSEHLIFYAVSRNNALADQAQQAIEAYLPKDRVQIAIMMSRTPQWVQVAFIESSRRRKTPTVTLLLGELKKISSSNDVVEEVDEVLR
jgi:hypothetical protein